MSVQYSNSRLLPESSFPPFYGHPHLPPVPGLYPPDVYKGLSRYDEDFWNSRIAERKLMDYQHDEKLFQRISPPKHLTSDPRTNEIDLTTTGHRNLVEDYGCQSNPRFFMLNRGDNKQENDRELSPRCASPPNFFKHVRDKYTRNSSFRPVLIQENGMMDKDENQEAMNLSAPKEGGTNLQNGECDSGHESQTSPLDAAKRKVKSNSAIETGNGLAGLFGQQADQTLALQQAQQMLQLGLGQGLTASQLQQLMQQQTMAVQHQQQQKLQEQVIQELNEQLQINMLQQSKLMQQPDKLKNSKSQQQLTQLAIQQQGLVQQIQQLQLQQRQFLLACLAQPFIGINQGMMSPVEIQQLWKEVAAQSGLQGEAKAQFNGLSSSRSQTSPTTPQSTWTNGLLNHMSQNHISGQHAPPSTDKDKEDDEPKFKTLFRHGICKWPGCDVQCENYQIFLRHISEEHHLDDRSTAQARVQMQVVSQLEIQLTREKELLQEMMKHLHMKPNDKNGCSEDIKPRPTVVINTTASELPPSPLSSSSISIPSPPKMTSVITSPTKIPSSHHMSASAPPTPVSLIPHSLALPIVMPPQLGMSSISKPPTPHSLSQPSTPTSIGPMRRRVSDKCNLPISAEIQRNRDFYKNTDVRPPFTYASLIRQAIIESQHKQLTLNEIYQWFQSTFSYFRRNEATWKNAVRHNLSLHKCFMRVEDVKGAVWTVDEVEFYKRRPQKIGGNMGIREIPSPGSDPSGFGDTLNASLRAAIEQANLQMLASQKYPGMRDTSSVSSAEDLSMKSSRHDSIDTQPKFEFPSREEYLNVKEEVTIEETVYEDHHSPLDRNSIMKEEHSMDTDDGHCDSQEEVLNLKSEHVSQDQSTDLSMASSNGQDLSRQNFHLVNSTVTNHV